VNVRKMKMRERIEEKKSSPRFAPHWQFALVLSGIVEATAGQQRTTAVVTESAGPARWE
jgi:hypothetical protein